MFFTYLRRELRRRPRQGLFIALGLAVGVGLVITVTAAASGVQSAQGTVLHSLYGVGTDMTVTKPPPKGAGGTGKLRILAGGGVPSAGTQFSRNVLTGAGLGALGGSDVASIARLPHVAAASGALALSDVEVSGTMPSAAGGLGGASSSISSDSFSVLGVDPSAGRVGPLSSSRLTSGRTLRGSDASANVALIDFNYAAQHKLHPGSTVKIGRSSGTATSFKVVGIVQALPGDTPAEVYLPLARAQALGTGPQASSLRGKVNTSYVAAGSAADIGRVQQEIGALLPSATVTSTSDLANEVTGSLASTASLADNLGKWLAAAVLIAAFCVASLLTMAAVSRRVREFGTLKALGWRTRRVVGQVIGETLALGIAGGVAGAALGLGGAALVASLAPPLTATVGQAAGSAATGAGAGGAARRLLPSAAHTVSVHLTAPVTAGAIALAVLLAIAGGLVAGVFGGWRAARLRPAAALSRIE